MKVNVERAGTGITKPGETAEGEKQLFLLTLI